jgi:hypothetical protein
MQKSKSLTELQRDGYDALLSSQRYKELIEELAELRSDLRKENPNASEEQLFRMWMDFLRHNEEYLVAISRICA